MNIATPEAHSLDLGLNWHNSFADLGEAFFTALGTQAAAGTLLGRPQQRCGA